MPRKSKNAAKRKRKSVISSTGSSGSNDTCTGTSSDLLNSSTPVKNANGQSWIQNKSSDNSVFIVDENNSANENYQTYQELMHSMQNMQNITPIQGQGHNQYGQFSVPSMSQPPPWLPMSNVILQRLDEMSNKLKSLDEIKLSINDIKQDINSLRRDVHENKENLTRTMNRLTDIEKGLEFQSHTVDTLESQKCQMQRTIDSLHKQMKTQTEDLLDLQCRSMRDNLLFYGIPEVQGENCINVIHKFCEEKLNMPDASEKIKIDRAHRFGRRDQRTGNRPIVAKFNFYQDRDEIKSKGKQLGGTTFGISEQFPAEIARRRRVLMPKFKQAKREMKNARLIKDKLYIDGAMYTADDIQGTD